MDKFWLLKELGCSAVVSFHIYSIIIREFWRSEGILYLFSKIILFEN